MAVARAHSQAYVVASLCVSVGVCECVLCRSRAHAQRQHDVGVCIYVGLISGRRHRRRRQRRRAQPKYAKVYPWKASRPGTCRFLIRVPPTAVAAAATDVYVEQHRHIVCVYIVGQPCASSARFGRGLYEAGDVDRVFIIWWCPVLNVFVFWYTFGVHSRWVYTHFVSSLGATVVIMDHANWTLSETIILSL